MSEPQEDSHIQQEDEKPAADAGAELVTEPVIDKPKAPKAKPSFKGELMKFGKYCAIAYIVITVVMYTPLYPMIVLRPDKNPHPLYQLDKIQDAPREEYFFDSHGSKLHGWLFRKPKSNVLVIIHHGNAGNILNRVFLAKAFIQSGASVFLYDYRGYGKSEGKISLPGILEDGLTAFDYASKEFKYPIVINYGESIGSGVACNVDNQRKASGLIIQSGIASLPNVAKGSVQWLYAFPDALWPQPQFDNRLLVAKSTTPLLIMHGEKDTMVACSNAEMLNSAAAATNKHLVRLPNCGHNNVGSLDPQIFQKAINDFIAERKKI